MTDTEDNVHSDAYRNIRFAENWNACVGSTHFRFFAMIAIEHLPPWLIEQLNRQSLTFADWSCAQGDGTDFWANHIDAQQIVGVDTSSVTIEQAAQRYPVIRFICEDWLEEGCDQRGAFDVVYSSNTLEYFNKPYDALRALGNRAKKAIVLALPYKEIERIDECFPLVLQNGFRLVWSQVVDCRQIPNTLWDGDQILLIYAFPNWLDSLGLTLGDCRIDQSDTIKEITTMLAERGRQITCLNHAVAERDGQIASLSQAMNNQHSYIVRLCAQLNTVLESRSWRMTKPQRVFARFIRDGKLLTSDRAVIIEKVRILGRRFPILLWLVRIYLFIFRRLGGHLFSLSLPVKYVACTNGSINYSTTEGDERQAPIHIATINPDKCALVSGLVSVIIPVYNQASMLSDSIESVLNQTYENFELIIINDGSTDNVESVLCKYINHPKIRIYTQQNQKLPKALSNAFDLARGEFWTWTSADNLMEPRQLELLVARLKSTPDLGMVYADYYAIDDRNQLLKDPWWRVHNRPDIRSSEIRLPHSVKYLNIVQDNFIGPCFMYRGWIGRLLGEYDPIQGIEDYDYWMRINDLFSIEHLGTDELLYRYRVHDNTLTARASDEKIFEKVKGLMQCEKERAAFYKESLVFYADSDAAEWLSSLGMLKFDICSISLFDSISLNEKCCLAVSADTLHELPCLLDNAGQLPVVILFNTGSTTPYDIVIALHRQGVLAAVTTPRAAWRVRAVAAIPVVDAMASDTGIGIHAFAKNHLFYETTRESNSRIRTVPVSFSSPFVKRKILLQIDSLVHGGIENVVIDLACTLNKQGFDSRLLVLGKGGNAVEKAKLLGLQVDVFNGNLDKDGYTNYIIKHEITVINAHYSIFGAHVAHELGIPFVQTIHNLYAEQEPIVIEQFRDADRYTYRYACFSLAAAKYADFILGIDIRKMTVISNGKDLTIFSALYQ